MDEFTIKDVCDELKRLEDYIFIPNGKVCLAVLSSAVQCNAMQRIRVLFSTY
jgi:hypothetical protein